MHIAAVSDLHGVMFKPENMPTADVLCICGDIVPLEYQNDPISSVSWFNLEFVPWVDSLPYEKVIFIGGNHDFFLEHIMWSDTHKELSGNAILKRLLPGINKSKHSKLVYLFDSSYTYKGVKFYGCPWISDLSNWAFYKPETELEKRWKMIQSNVDVLMTHMPPMLNDCGAVLRPAYFGAYSNYGSQSLANAILEKSPKYAICGHVHSGNHIPYKCENTTCVNVSLLDEEYRPYYRIFEFDIEK